MTALVDQEGAVVTENGRRQIIRKICETNPALLKAGATVRVDLFEGASARGQAFDTVAATRKDCAIRRGRSIRATALLIAALLPLTAAPHPCGLAADVSSDERRWGQRGGLPCVSGGGLA